MLQVLQMIIIRLLNDHHDTAIWKILNYSNSQSSSRRERYQFIRSAIQVRDHLHSNLNSEHDERQQNLGGNIIAHHFNRHRNIIRSHNIFWILELYRSPKIQSYI